MAIDYFELEGRRSELIGSTLNISSAILRSFHFYKYFNDIIKLNEPAVEEAFLKEFVYEYLSDLSKYEVWGIDPDFSVRLLQQLKDLAKRSFISDPQKLNSEISRIEDQSKKLLHILNGNEITTDGNFPAYFPLIEKDTDEAFFGIIDSVTITISRAAKENKFIIVPSEKNSDQRITEQCSTSWQLALTKLIHYVRKPYRYHKVIINFEKKEGYYEGNSLGVALTISFLDQLLKFYNPIYSIIIAQKIAFTGAVTEKGKTDSTGNQIIKQKVAAIFFSDIKTFVFPKSEESSAIKELNELNGRYPNRVLKLLPAEDISDVLNRRDIVEIKKRNIILRTGKFLRKNWISSTAILLMVLLFSYEFLLDFDKNPSSLASDGSILFIKNKNGKILWIKSLPFDSRTIISTKEILSSARIVDINSDGQNEVVILDATDKKNGYLKNSRILNCYNYSNKLIWNFSFTDKIISRREKLDGDYGLSILDTLTYLGQKSLFLISSNGPSFSSVIYRIDLMTGKRLPGTFWSSGHVLEACIKDINDDKKPDIVGAGYDNGYEDLVFFAYEIDTLTRVRPTTGEYLIEGFPQAGMEAYIRFPKSDFDNYKKVRTPAYSSGTFLIDDKNQKFAFGSDIPFQSANPGIGYEINYNLKDIDVVILSTFRVQRDTLVAHGILNPPFTDTEEYKNIIKSHILYWKNGKWLKRNELY